ncbi:MAG: tol-pal system-associated acyl-CoA thioesterase [Pseudomonadota bacterium]
MPAEFTWPVRVYYEDTDAGGIVFYANYLKFFERARTEWLRACGVNQHQLLQEDGAIFVVKHAAIDYHAPAKLDDELKLTLRIEKLGRASVQFVQEAWCCDAMLAVASVKVGCVDANTLRPRALSAATAAKMRTA